MATATKPATGLAFKMIVTTTLLVVVTVAGSGVLNAINVRSEIDEATAKNIAAFRAAREASGAWATPLFARAIQQAISERGQDESIRETLAATVGGDSQDLRGHRDYGVRLGLVLDQKRDVVAHCLEDEAMRCAKLDASHPPLASAGLGEVTTAAWQQAIAEWRKAAAAAGPKRSALVTFSFPADVPAFRVFAVPIMLSGPATPEAALADAADNRLGYVMLGYDLAPIEAFSEEAERDKAAATRRALLYSGAVGALFVLIGTVLAILQGLSITRPIKQLAARAEQIARGDLEARVDVTSRDEIGVLGHNFNTMANHIATLLEQTAEKARIEQELEVAKAIQETLVPSPAPVDHGVLKFAGFYQPAAQTGGDWWTWHELIDGKILVVVGDVTGHGVPSAMITAAAKAACDVARHVHRDLTLTRLLEIMNQAIWQSAQRRFVMTCFASIVDTRARTITYANAGHNFPYLFRTGDGRGEFGSLMIRGNRLGDDPASRYEAKTTELVVGDVLVWYTDGIVECENEQGEEYGEKRFRASVRRAGALDAGEMRDSIVGEATAFFGAAPRKDDMTMIVGRIH